MIIDDFKFANVTMLHHHSEKTDDDFGAQPNKHLAFASLFGIVDALESISQDIHAHHGGGAERWRESYLNVFKISTREELSERFITLCNMRCHEEMPQDSKNTPPLTSRKAN